MKVILKRRLFIPILTIPAMMISGCSASGRLIKALDNGDRARSQSIVETKSSFAGEKLRDRIPLCIAVAKGYDEVVAGLLKKGADPNVKGANGFSPLYYAARTGNNRIVSLLLDAGAKPDFQLIDGWTPLMAASDSGFVGTAGLLLKSGANIRAKNKWGATALYMAAVSSRNEAVKLLLENGADPNASLTNEWTPLLAAVDANDIDIAKELIDHGAFVQGARDNAPSMLWTALAKNNISAGRLLLSHGANVDERPFETTPLMAAVLTSRIDWITLFLDRNADVNFVLEKYGTALMIAISQARFDIVDLLLERGADVSKTDFHGNNALAAWQRSFVAEPTPEQIRIGIALYRQNSRLNSSSSTRLASAKFQYLLAAWNVYLGNRAEADKLCKESAQYYSLAANDFDEINRDARKKLRREKVGDFFSDIAIGALQGAANGANAALTHTTPIYTPVNLPDHNYSSLEEEISWSANVRDRCYAMAAKCQNGSFSAIPVIAPLPQFYYPAKKPEGAATLPDNNRSAAFSSSQLLSKQIQDSAAEKSTSSVNDTMGRARDSAAAPAITAVPEKTGKDSTAVSGQAGMQAHVSNMPAAPLQIGRLTVIRTINGMKMSGEFAGVNNNCYILSVQGRNVQVPKDSASDISQP